MFYALFLALVPKDLCATRKASERVHIAANEWQSNAKLQHHLDSSFCCYYSCREKKLLFTCICDACTMKAPEMLKCLVQRYKVYKDHVIHIKYA